MKGDITMTRKMGNFEVKQRTKDAMFNATALLEQWNINNPNSKKRMNNFWFHNKNSIHEFLSEMDSDLNDSDPSYFKLVDFEKLKSKYTDTRRGKINGGTWMNPYLFVKFAMWISPKFEYQVVKFVYDQLIQYRHKAGDNYKKLNSAIRIFRPDVDQRKELARALNYIVFGKHEHGLRDTATEDQLKRIHELEDKYSMLIEEGYISTYDQLIGKLRKEYSKVPF